MSRRYVLEHPVDNDDDEDEDDEFDEFDDDGDGDEDDDEDEDAPETWQVSNCDLPLKDALCLTSATVLA